MGRAHAINDFAAADKAGVSARAIATEPTAGRMGQPENSRRFFAAAIDRRPRICLIYKNET